MAVDEQDLVRNSLIMPKKANGFHWGRQLNSIGFVLLALFFLIFPTLDHEGCAQEQMGIIDDLRQIEKSQIKINKLSETYYGYVRGQIPILISAPHGARHYRACESRWKAEDAYTSSLAIVLGRLTGAHVIYLKNKAAEDPNNDIHSRYKDFLANVVRENGIRFLIDLHGAHRDQPFKIDVGTLDNRTGKSSCPTFRPVIAEAFRDYDGGLFNKQFRATNPGTITYFAKHDLGIEAAQFEINALCRILESRSDPSLRANEQDVLDLVGRLQKMIAAINEKISETPSKSPLTISKQLGKL
jgi:hypothetical protein